MSSLLYSGTHTVPIKTKDITRKERKVGLQSSTWTLQGSHNNAWDNKANSSIAKTLFAFIIILPVKLGKASINLHYKQ